MKKISMLVSVLLAVCLCLSATAWAEQEDSTIRVTGRASIGAVPDIVTLRFGVEIIDADAANAQRLAGNVIADAIDAMLDMGVSENNITNDSMMIRREWDYSDSTPKALGFAAYTQLVVKLDDIQLAGKVVDAVLEKGVNTLDGIELYSSKQAEYYDRALTVAMNNARHKAEVLAEAAGTEIVGVNFVTEDYSPSMYKNTNSSYEGAGAPMADEGGTVIASGEIEIEANITAEFIVK